MQVYTGDTRKLSYIDIINEMGWGRLWSARCPTVYQCDLTPTWVFDNNVFSETFSKRGSGYWDCHAWQKRMWLMHERDLTPQWCALPDIVSSDISDHYTDHWLNWLACSDLNEIQTTFAIVLQDGMTPQQVARWLDEWNEYDEVITIDTLFLGGGDGFKQLAPAWAKFAHSRGMDLHYARAGTPDKMRHAIDSGADSLDSAFPLWTNERFAEYVNAA